LIIKFESILIYFLFTF